MTSSSAAAATAPRIADIRLQGLQHIDEALTRSVLPVRPGDPFEPQKVDQAVNYLRRWGVFDTINVFIDSSSVGAILTFQLAEATVVRSIDIAGNYPYVENRVRKYLSLHPGNIYTPKAVEEQLERIQDFYRREGFADARVSVEEKFAPEDNGVDVVFHIHRGAPLRYERIKIDGNNAYPDGRFTALLRAWRPYSEQRLRRSLREIASFYHDRGYPKAKIRIDEKTFDLARHRVHPALRVIEGPFVAVDFRGNRVISDRSLKEIVTIFREGSYDLFEIEASRDAIREAYVEKGFPDVLVAPEKTELPDGSILIAFTIDEGKPQSIKRIDFTGNEEVSSGKLKAGLENHEPSTGIRGLFLPEKIDDDAERIRQKMRTEGFREATVEEWRIRNTRDGFAKIVTIPIEEGPRTLIDAIHISGNRNIPERALRQALPMREKLPFNADGVEKGREAILINYADHGFPYAKVTISTSVDETAHRATIAYEIDEGKEVRIGNILIIGDVLTSQRAIKKAMSIKEGAVYSSRRILESQLNIRRLGPFASVKIETIGLEANEEVVHLRVKVEEQRPFLVDLEFGYSTDDQYTGALKFTNRNAFGWAKRNTLTLTAGRELSRVELGWLDPRFLSSSFEMSTNGWIQYKEDTAFTFIQLGGALGWFRRFQRVGLLFRVELDRNYFVEGSSTAADAQSLRNNTIIKTAVSGSYDSRDNFADPRRGVLLIASNELFNEVRGNEANFDELSLSGEYDISPFSHLTLSSSARTNRIQTIGENISVPSNELLFLGGDDTIRGYTEDSVGPVDATGRPIGGRTRWIINEELRFRLTSAFSTALFYDIGQLTNEVSDLSVADARQAAGFGLRYLTPVGPLRADYGFKIGKRADESRGRFHFTFGYVF